LITRAALALISALALGCNALPTTINRTPAASSPTPAATDGNDGAGAGPSAEPVPGDCEVAVVLDPVGHGAEYKGSGFQPETPLEATFDNHTNGQSATFTEVDFPELRTDIRGAFLLHLFAQRKDIGDTTFTVTDGQCIAETDFTTPADRFPEVECTPEVAAPGANDASDEYASLVSEESPISYWRFEETPGDEIRNSDGAAAEPFNDVVLGQPGFIEGSRSALLVESVAEDESGTDVGGWLDIPDLELAGDFTIEAWYRFCGEFIWAQDALVGQGGEGPDINFFEWRARLYNGDSDVVVSSQIVSSGGWHHLAVTRDGADVTLYEDGAETDTGTLAEALPMKAIGRGEGGRFGSSFGGWVDEVAFYDHALTAEQVAAHAAFGDHAGVPAK